MRFALVHATIICQQRFIARRQIAYVKQEESAAASRIQPWLQGHLYLALAAYISSGSNSIRGKSGVEAGGRLCVMPVLLVILVQSWKRAEYKGTDSHFDAVFIHKQARTTDGQLDSHRDARREGGNHTSDKNRRYAACYLRAGKWVESCCTILSCQFLYMPLEVGHLALCEVHVVNNAAAIHGWPMAARLVTSLQRSELSCCACPALHNCTRVVAGASMLREL